MASEHRVKAKQEKKRKKKNPLASFHWKTDFRNVRGQGMKLKADPQI